MTTTRLSRLAFAPLALLPLFASGAARAGAREAVFDEVTGEELVRVDNCPANGRAHGHGMRCLSSRLVTRSYAEAHKIGPFTAPPDAGAGVDASVDITACNGVAGGGGSGGGTPTSLGPPQFNKAFNIPSAPLAAGKIVAIVDACAETNIVADLTAYRKKFNLPALPECGGKNGVAPTPGGAACFGLVSQRGDGNLPPPDDGWAGEIALDVDMVSMGCPECSIVLIEADSPNSWDLGPAVDEAVALGASAVSNSYGEIRIPNDPYGVAFSDATYEKYYQHPGVLIAVASGDASYNNENWNDPYPGNLPAYLAPGFPSTVPEVLSVGGTNLTASSGTTRGYTETVWEGSTSGCSTEFPKPAYQSGISMGSCTMRADVDVAAPASNIAVYQGGWENGFAGTSCASPFVAGFLTHLGLAGEANVFFYEHPSGFFDLGAGGGTNDTNGICSDVMCTAGAGWDGPSGLGSPNGAILGALDGGSSEGPGDAGVDATLPTDGGTPVGDDGGGVTPGDDSGGVTPPGDSGGVTPPGDSGGVTPPEDSGSGIVPPGDGGPVLEDGGPVVVAEDGGNGTTGSSNGCGCVTAGASSSSSVPGGAALALFGLLLAGRRRRRG